MNAAIRLQALGDLLGRYGFAFRQAWRRRDELKPVSRLPHEAQFLPAALALQETPVSPLPRVAMWLLIAFAGIAMLWSAFGHIDVVATANGKIVPNERIKTIQPFETAVVKAIHVSDGQTVRAGDVLVELDATGAQADTERLMGELDSARLQAARAKAMLAAIGGGGSPRLTGWQGLDEVKLREAQSLLLGQFQEYGAKVARIDAEIGQRQAELHSTQELVYKLTQTVPIARQREQDYKDLLDRNFISKHGYMEREQDRIEKEADLATQRSKLKEIEAALRQANSQRAELTAETRRLNLGEINDGLQKVAGLAQEHLKADTRSKLMKLTSPVDGTVQQLAVHTIGGVVTPAQPMMVIVPRDSVLEVEAFVENKDVGFVKAGQDAEVKVEAFQYTKYGTIHAKVVSVSHDAISDEKHGLVYSAQFKMDRGSINVDGTEVNLSPGMAVSAEVKTGKRRVIEYFLSPLLQYGHESLRER
jgi:hemolysin D